METQPSLVIASGKWVGTKQMREERFQLYLQCFISFKHVMAKCCYL